MLNNNWSDDFSNIKLFISRCLQFNTKTLGEVCDTTNPFMSLTWRSSCYFWAQHARLLALFFDERELAKFKYFFSMYSTPAITNQHNHFRKIANISHVDIGIQNDCVSRGNRLCSLILLPVNLESSNICSVRTISKRLKS